MRSGPKNGRLPLAWPARTRIPQKIALAFGLFTRNELSNQAGAAAYYFVLSVPPVLLLVLYLADHYLTAVPGLSDELIKLLAGVNENINESLFRQMGLLDVASRGFGLIGLLSLVWVSRLMFSTIQRAFALIFPAERPRPAVITYLLSFLLLPVLLFLAFGAVAISAGLSVLHSSPAVVMSDVVRPVLVTATRLGPPLLMFLFALLSYRLIPVKRPRRRSALEGALVYTGLTLLFRVGFRLLFRVTRYSLIYGFFGSLIIVLVWVYFTFFIFYLAAEYTYVADHIDVLIMQHLYRVSRQSASGLERLLFRSPTALLARFARTYGSNQMVIQEGSRGREVYYVHRGEVRITKGEGPNERTLYRLSPGEFFGEMSYLLDEPRTAGATTDVESVLFVVPPQMFEELLHTSDHVSRDVIQVLCDRLKRSTDQVTL